MWRISSSTIWHSWGQPWMWYQKWFQKCSVHSKYCFLILNPLSAIDANWRHENCWWCHFLGNFPLEIGSVTAEMVGRGEVGGVTQRLKMAPAKPCVACGAHLLGAKRATCHVFSMSGCRKQSFPLAAPPNCMFTAAFSARAHWPCPSKTSLESGCS